MKSSNLRNIDVEHLEEETKSSSRWIVGRLLAQALVITEGFILVSRALAHESIYTWLSSRDVLWPLAIAALVYILHLTVEVGLRGPRSYFVTSNRANQYLKREMAAKFGGTLVDYLKSLPIEISDDQIVELNVTLKRIMKQLIAEEQP